jgi:ribosomal protein L7/L12
MPTCPFCNEANPPGVGACKKCGGTIPQEELPAELSDFEKELLGLLQGGRKIDAIKRCREKTGQGLKEAKDAVEALGAKYGIETKGAGCASVILFLMLIPLAWRLFA